MKRGPSKQLAKPLHDVWTKSTAKEYAVTLNPMHITQNRLLNPSQRRWLPQVAKLAEHQESNAAIQYKCWDRPDISGDFMVMH
jgi:hypothetical protein